MNDSRSRVARRRWRPLIIVLAAITATAAWGVPQEAAKADPLVPAPTTGTATGSYRTGPARAGLVQLTSLSAAHVYLGVAAGGTVPSPKTDVRVELLDNGASVASGVVRCIAALTSTPTEVVVPWSPVSASTLHVGDVLSLRVSSRLGTKPDDSKCASNGQFPGIRAYYDATSTPTRFGATVTPNPAVTLYAHSDGTACASLPSSGITAASLGMQCREDAACDRAHRRYGRYVTGTRTLDETAPSAVAAKCQDSGRLDFHAGNPWQSIATWNLAAQCDCANQFIPEVRNSPAAPAPEPVAVSELPLPPTAPSSSVGACTLAVNPNGTGCISAGDGGIAEGPGYMSDGHHVLLPVVFDGAPAAPDPASIYAGSQVIAVKTDGTTFSNGDPWKCITCGVPAANKVGADATVDHPQAFHDGMHAVVGTNVLDCSPYLITDDACTPAVTHLYKIRFDTAADHSGPGASIRELRLNPDDVHLGFNRLIIGANGFAEWAYMARLTFNPSPSTGTPLAARYDLTNAYVMFHPDANRVAESYSVDPSQPGQLLYNSPKYFIGEFRGWTSDGQSAIGIGFLESWNSDVYATSLATGVSSRLSRDPAYTDPVKASPDDQWSVVMDGRVDHRMYFLSGVPGLPAMTDMAATGSVLPGVYNNGNRRFFEPYLIDRYGDRGSYHGQQLNACGPTDDPTPGSGSICDPLWNGRADPTWSPDGTNVVYWQALATSPACGPSNPSVPLCPTSTEPGGRRTRLMIARLTSRSPQSIAQPAPVPDAIPWGMPYTAGDADPNPSHLATGTYTLNGQVIGSASISVTENATHTAIVSISVAYTNFSDDGVNVINGTESASVSGSAFFPTTTFHQNLTLSGCHTGSKVTSEPGGWVVSGGIVGAQTRTGTLTTTVDGVSYTSPNTGT